MTKKIPGLPEYLLQQAKTRSAIQIITEGFQDQEELGLLSDNDWRAKMDEIEARLARLEEAVNKKRQQTAKGE